MKFLLGGSIQFQERSWPKARSQPVVGKSRQTLASQVCLSQGRHHWEGAPADQGKSAPTGRRAWGAGGGHHQEGGLRVQVWSRPREASAQAVLGAGARYAGAARVPRAAAVRRPALNPTLLRPLARPPIACDAPLGIGAVVTQVGGPRRPGSGGCRAPLSKSRAGHRRRYAGAGFGAVPRGSRRVQDPRCFAAGARTRLPEVPEEPALRGGAGSRLFGGGAW